MATWYRRIFVLAIPLILSNLTQPLLSTVDTILSGHLPGASALGGVAVAGIFFNAIFWSFGFLRMGTTGLVAQAHGARDHHALRLHLLRGLLSAVTIGLVLVALKQPLIHLSLGLLGATGAVLQNADAYCQIRIWSAPAALANYAILGFLLGRQRARTALALQAAINVVNVAVALLLVLKLHWGVAGIATATLTAEWVGCAVGLLLLRIPSSSLENAAPIHWRELLDAPSLRRLFALNRDIFLRTLGLVAAYAWFTRTGARQGETILAANALLMNLHMIASYGLDGFANATEALVGEAIGAKRQSDFHKILRASTLSAFAVAALISLTYLILGPWLVSLFTNQETVRLLALHYLPWAVALPVVAVWGFQLDGVFIGATRARELRDSMLLSFAGFWLMAVLFQRWMGNHGLWCAFLGFMILRGGNLALRLPRIEKNFAEQLPVSSK
jgi:MATE family multidrug resistance protein